MSNISKAFQNKKAVAGFITAGDGGIKFSENILIKMAEAGCDFIVLGIPFSDPIAEDPIVQSANIRSLENGTYTDEVFKIVKNVTEKINIPIVLKSYLNVFFKYGYERFLQNAKESGVSSILVPDMPFEEQQELESVAKNYNIEIISTLTSISGQRIEMIAENAKGFICEFVSPKDKEDNDGIINTLNTAKRKTNVPVVFSLDATNKEEVLKYIQFADGIIIDTEFVRIIEKSKENAPNEIFNFIKSIKESLQFVIR